MARISLLILVVLVVAGAGVAGSVRLNYFEVERDANDFVLTWQAENEDGLRGYEVRRKTSYMATFGRIHTLSPHGARKEYRFRDDQVYKSADDEVEYCLDAALSTGERLELGCKSVTYTATFTRRTWALSAFRFVGRSMTTVVTPATRSSTRTSTCAQSAATVSGSGASPGARSPSSLTTRHRRR